ncbi:MAG: hypothetical protein EOP39_04335 [Rubrivivax sp.]|nr:MAG: hypothetical protein EOP39_04335 [Rubrivivax sp.]
MTLALTSTCVGGRRAGPQSPILVPPRRPRLPSIRPANNAAGRLWGLTARECEVIEAYIAHGLGKVAAPALGISVKTFDAFISRILDRVGAVSSVQLVAFYVTAQLKGSAA